MISMRGPRVSDATAPSDPEPSNPDSTDRAHSENDQSRSAPVQLPSSQPLLLRALRLGALMTVVLIIVFAVVGWFVAGSPGLVGGVIGAGSAGIFLALTVGSIAFANRFVASEVFVGIFFGIVLGTWLFKFILFIVAALLLRGQPWLDPLMFFLALLAGVISSLVIDVLVVTKSRMPYVSDASETGNVKKI